MEQTFAQTQPLLRAAAYARFSSEMQRDESINAQLRAIRSYAQSHNLLLTKEYTDRAHSATTDQRPEFLQMIADAKQGAFDIIIVHKLDRFSRNRYDSAIYRRELKLAGVEIRSVLENLDGSPESLLLESLLEGINEFYSRNLAREVQKGKKENALQGKHVGGTPPLGYRVNPATLLLEIEPFEAQAVQLIFRLYLEGAGYGEILDTLNRKGYRTKRGRPFGKNSLYEILRNEKYSGVYTYNKSCAKDVRGKMNRHKFKPEAEIIRTQNALPALVSPEDFAAVQQKMQQRKHSTGRFKAQQVYLLSGKITCGECGSTFGGNARRPRPDHPLYTSYRCTRRNQTVRCRNREIRSQTLDEYVLHLLANNLFDERLLPELYDRYAAFAAAKDVQTQQQLSAFKTQLETVQSGIDNIVQVVLQTGSAALADKLQELETQKAALQREIQIACDRQKQSCPSYEALQAAFMRAKELLQSGSSQHARRVVEQYVERVVLFTDRIEVHLRIGDFAHVVTTKRELLS